MGLKVNLKKNKLFGMRMFQTFLCWPPFLVVNW